MTRIIPDDVLSTYDNLINYFDGRFENPSVFFLVLMMVLAMASMPFYFMYLYGKEVFLDFYYGVPKRLRRS